MVASIIAILGGSTAASAANNFRFSMVSNVIGKRNLILKIKLQIVKVRLRHIDIIQKI